MSTDEGLFNQVDSFLLGRESPVDSRICIAGLNHRVAPIALRERFALPDERKREVLGVLRAVPEIREAVIVSTCNRVELIVAGEGAGMVSELREIFCSIAGDELPDYKEKCVDQALYHFHNREAVSHIFRVASGLDSLVLGEPQILGQVKDAYDLACQEGMAGSLLHRLFHRAFHVAKVVRSSTGIGQRAVSVCYAAKELAEQIFGDLSQASVMLIGAGDTGALAIKHFARAGVKRFFIANKRLARAVELADTCAGVPINLSAIAQYIGQCDIVIGAAQIEPGATTIVSEETVRASSKTRLGNPQFYIDLGVPRNFPTLAASLDDTYLYNIDDLDVILEANRASRVAESARAELLIEAEVERFNSWIERRELEHIVRALQLKLRSLEESEVRKTSKRLGRSLASLSAEELSQILEPALRDLVQSVLAKTLHNPLTKLRDCAGEDQAVVAVFRQLFSADSESADSELE